jgi:hypothetical protein
LVKTTPNPNATKNSRGELVLLLLLLFDILDEVVGGGVAEVVEVDDMVVLFMIANRGGYGLVINDQAAIEAIGILEAARHTTDKDRMEAGLKRWMTHVHRF